MAHSIVSIPENSISSEDNDNVVTHLTWKGQMEFEDAKLEAEKVSKSVKCPKGKKLHLTKVKERTEQCVHTNKQ